jgi:DNA-binding beta-propeller fold protein YncE
MPDVKTSLTALSLGEVFAGHRIDTEVGRGGMGVVYRAFHLALEIPVALKVILPEFAASQDFRERFQRESRIAASIDHPNVVPIRHAGEADGLLYITMRLIEGTDLAALLREHGRQSPLAAVAITAQIAAGLDAAHARGLAHRDIKPANVLLEPRDDTHHAYVTDFGLAAHALATTALTPAGQFVGTVDYIAPEQLEGVRIDARADVYSLGCVVYHMLTGGVPYPRPRAAATMYAQLHDPPPPLSEALPGADARLADAVRRAMAKDPADRFLSAGDFGRALGAAVEGREVSPREQSVAVGDAALHDRAHPSRRRIRRPARALVGLAGGLLVLAAVALLALTRLGGETASATVVGKPIQVGRNPVSLAAGAGSVWVANADDGTLTRLDSGSGRVQERAIPLGLRLSDIAVGHGKVWVPDGEAVNLVDARSGTPLERRVRLKSPSSIAVDKTGAWVTNPFQGTLSRIDPTGTRVVGSPIEAGDGANAITIERQTAWVLAGFANVVQRIDLGSRERVGDPIPLGGPGADVQMEGDIAIGFGAAWVVNFDEEGTVTRLNVETGRMVGEPIRVGEEPKGVAVGADAVWVANSGDGTVSRIDPDSGEVVGEPIEVGGTPGKLVVSDGIVWVTNDEDDTVVRIRP